MTAALSDRAAVRGHAVAATGALPTGGTVFTASSVVSAGTVGSAMLLAPTVHPADLTVAQAREAFAASAKRHLLLLVRDGVLVGTLTRDDLARDNVAGTVDPRAPALPLASLNGRTAAPDAPLARAHEAMYQRGIRRLAVTDGRGQLLGLLCLKRSRRAFCTDDGVAAMRLARLGQPGAGD